MSYPPNPFPQGFNPSKSTQGERKIPTSLYEELDVCRARVDYAKAIQRDFNDREASLLERIRKLRDELNKLRNDYGDSARIISEYEARFEETLAKIRDWKSYKPSTRVVIASREDKLLKKRRKLLEKLADVERSLEEEAKQDTETADREERGN